MDTTETINSTALLERHGIKNPGQVHWTPPTSVLYEHAIERKEGIISDAGPLVVSTGQFTGRTPKDKFIVKEPGSQDRIWWQNNAAFEPEQFDRLHARVGEYLSGKELWVQDCYVGSDPDHRRSVRVINEIAWHNLFVRNLFIRQEAGSVFASEPDFTIISAPRFKADPERDGTRSPAFVILNFDRRLILIGGTEYAGEMKKSIFTFMHYVLPLEGVLSMHCSANVGPNGDTALFFGLSGTGKTTLSTDPDRQLIGDDEHGWTDHGIFNFEGGCYAKVIRLSAESEPEIYGTTRRFGTVLENVSVDAVTRALDLDDASVTENTRAAYPLEFIPNCNPAGMGGHPENIIFLTADAFGVLPPISRLSPEQAQYHFLSGYTAKVAGTEVGLTAPEATFSTCFGAPFLPLPPHVYAEMLAKRVVEHGSNVWLVNTGWIGGSAVDSDRVPIRFTRAMINAVLSGDLLDVSMHADPIFGLSIPDSCPGVPQDVLDPRGAWKDKDAYDKQAKKLAAMFQKNFAKFEDQVDQSVKDAGPRA